MKKTSTISQAETANRRREEGQKQTSLWLDQETQKQLAVLSGMNKSQAMTTALKVGLYALGLVKEQNSDLYLEIVDGELYTLETKLDELLLSD